MSSGHGPTCCPHCGAQQRPGMTRCWICGLGEETEPPPEPMDFAPSVPAAAQPRRRQRWGISFTLASLLGLMSVVAVAAGLFHFAPGLSIVILLFFVPAMMLTAIASNQQRRRGTPMSPHATLAHFCYALVISVVVVVVALVVLSILFMWVLA